MIIFSRVDYFKQCLLNSSDRKMKNLVVRFTAVIFIYSCRSVLFLSLLSD